MREWIENTAAEELFVSVMALGEIRRGIERIRFRDPKQTRTLEHWLFGLRTEFADRILPVGEQVADHRGRPGLTQPVPLIDGLLAATALAHNLTVVSRDKGGFRNTGVRFLNPFSGRKPSR